MTEPREHFLDGIMAFRHAMKSINMEPSKMTVIISEEDGRKLEHYLTRLNQFTISPHNDPRYSTPKADKHIREFEVCGVKFQYRTKPFMMPSGDIL